MDPITANYLMDYLYFSRDDELFRYYKKVRTGDLNSRNEGGVLEVGS